jgi:flagellar P-ring protein precursor FlgI
MRLGRWFTLVAVAALLPVLGQLSASQVRTARIRELATVEGVRENPLVGYGLVAGLRGTGDSQQTIFTTQMLANALQKMGMQVTATQVKVKNVASVFVTASLPAFARSGTQLDVTVSSMGDASSLSGGTLLMTPLRAADGQIYAAAQGTLTVGGYSASGPGTTKQVNHPTAGRIPGGALVERESTVDLSTLPRLTLLLREPDFDTAQRIADSINRELGQMVVARAADGRSVELKVGEKAGPIPAMLAQVENLEIPLTQKSKVVVSERTGTIVMGKDVRLGAVSILHGNLSIEVATELHVSQPLPNSKGGQTVVTPQTTVKTQDSTARRIELHEGANVEQLVNGLQAIGATAQDVISILQAIKAAGALQAELEVI